jgi:hypothetical protein
MRASTFTRSVLATCATDSVKRNRCLGRTWLPPPERITSRGSVAGTVPQAEAEGFERRSPGTWGVLQTGGVRTIESRITMPGPGDELKATLTEQHEHVKELMEAVKNSHGDGRRHAFDEFRVFLAAHEAAEAECVHSVGKAELDDADVVDERISEEDEAGEAIAGLEDLGTDHEEFLGRFNELSKNVIDHAEAEEHEELPKVLEAASDDEIDGMLETLSRVPTLAPLGTSGAGIPFEELLATARRAFNPSRGGAS